MVRAALVLAFLLIGQVRWREIERQEIDTVAETETKWKHVNVDFGAAANWDNGIPGTSSDMVAIFDGGGAQVSPQENLDQTGAANAFRIVTTRDYRAGIGSQGNPLILLPVGGNKVATIRGSGNTYLKFAGSAVGTHAIIDVPMFNSSVQLDTDSNVSLGPLMIKNGRVEILRTCQLAQMTVCGLSIVTIEPAASTEDAPNPLVIRGGTVYNKRDFAAADRFIVVDSGELHQTGLIPSECYIIVTGGRMTYVPDSDPSGEAPPLFVLGGMFDCRDYDGSIPFGHVIKFPGAQIYGTIIDQSAGLVDYDLNEDYP